jgi:biopolymer transport protein ExbD
MKILSPLPHKRGRLEIIPLIDIMFFLLAAFMMVSINKIKVDSLKITLPTDVPSVTHETKEDFVSISVDTDGNVQVDKEKIASKEQFLAKLQDLYAKNHDQKILISADQDTHHGDVMMILGKIRQAGFQRVAFNIKKGGTNGGVSSGSDAPTAPLAAPTVTPGPDTSAPAPAATGAASVPATSGAATTPAPETAPAPASVPAPAGAPAPEANPAAPTPPAGQ